MLDGDIRVAIEQERLSRRKHGKVYWYESPVQKSIDYCLSAEGITIDDVGHIVSADTFPARLRHDLRGRDLKLFPHHLCHAASAYMMLPVGTRAGIFVWDGYGSICQYPPDDPLHCLRETFSFHLFGGHHPTCLGRTLGRASLEGDDFPIRVTNSMGLLYELVTATLGYEPEDAGKTMGLSSHGRPRYRETFDRFISFGDTPSDCFRCALDEPALPAALDQLLMNDRGSFGVRADIAASLQDIMNETGVRCIRFFDDVDIDHLCISGGCGLNTVANAHLVERGAFDMPLSIPPHCGDAGLAFGAMWLHEFERLGHAPAITFRGEAVSPALARPGRLYDAQERTAAVQQFYPRIVLDPSVRSAHDLSRVIAEGNVVGIFVGRSEVGPRALGGRSILADPRSVLTRERINRLIKRREPYRPLAPVVLESRYDDYFRDPRCADPFMLKVSRARPRCLERTPAVVHVDGTARVQVVSSNGEEFLVALLQAFDEITGEGLLLNTSFNRNGEPIVESPADAIDAFLGLGLDGLFLDGEFYRPAPRPSL
jgi:carbamoyltransferase